MFRDLAFTIPGETNRLTMMFPNYNLDPLKTSDLNQGSSKQLN